MSPTILTPTPNVPVGVVTIIGKVDVGLATASELNLLPWSNMFSCSIAPIVGEYENSFAPAPVATLLLRIISVSVDVPPKISSASTKIPV